MLARGTVASATMADVVPLLKQGLSTLKSGQLPEVSLLRALVSKVTKWMYSISTRRTTDQHVSPGWLRNMVLLTGVGLRNCSWSIFAEVATDSRRAQFWKRGGSQLSIL